LLWFYVNHIKLLEYCPAAEKSQFTIQETIQNHGNLLILMISTFIRNEKVGCSIHLSGTNGINNMASLRKSGAFLLQVRAAWRVMPFIGALELNG
jgi:hypothetical protein